MIDSGYWILAIYQATRIQYIESSIQNQKFVYLCPPASRHDQLLLNSPRIGR